MASAAAVVASLTDPVVAVPLFGAASAAAAAYAAYAAHVVLAARGGWWAGAVRFATGPGRTSRLLLAVLLLANLKSLPLAWTARVFGAMARHALVARWQQRRGGRQGQGQGQGLLLPPPPQALFGYSISATHTTLLETDYNLHKSNSTYFADLDASRTHLVMRLLGPGMAAAGRNARTRLVCAPGPDGTPGAGAPMPGRFGIGLGAVFCSFRREIAPYQPYELWSRVLAWDRKWLYVVTHFVAKGQVQPATPGSGAAAAAAAAAAAWTAEDEARLQKHVFATGISKYVFKLGRFTVHPAIVLGASGLLPPRPGSGWQGGGPAAVGDLDDAVEPVEGEDETGDGAWKRIERERRRGMVLAGQFGALDEANALFDGGKRPALGVFGPG